MLRYTFCLKMFNILTLEGAWTTSGGVTRKFLLEAMLILLDKQASCRCWISNSALSRERRSILSSPRHGYVHLAEMPARYWKDAEWLPPLRSEKRRTLSQLPYFMSMQVRLLWLRCYFAVRTNRLNIAPHVGHLYTIVLADILKRWQVLLGNTDAQLLTGTDEHGMKVLKE
jgi:hypothetical protein